MMQRGLSWKTIKLYFYRFKDSVWYTVALFGGVVLVSLLLIWLVILPQLNRWFSIQNEIRETEARITAIRNNTVFLNNLNNSALDKNLQIVSSAIPFEKDYAGILSAITTAAVFSGVSVSDYSFQIGQLTQLRTAKEGYSPLQLTLRVDGDIPSVKRFIEEMQQRLPLTEFREWQAEPSSSSLTVVFFHKDFPKIVLEDAKPLAPLSSSQLRLVNTLSSWRLPILDASPSATADESQAFPF